MVYEYKVKHRGKWYMPGENVPDDNTGAEKSASEKSTDDSKKEYTKTEINRMSTNDLQELAKNTGIENAIELTGAELKKLLIEKFGL